MKDRIRQIMESQHMTQQVFAQFIGMSPASLSSIFNERTKPSLNIVEAIKKKIPDISTDWLMFGSGPMYIGSDSQQEPSPTTPQQGADQSRVGVSAVLDFSDTPTPAVENAVPAASVFNSVRNTHPNHAREDLKIIDKPPRRVTEIRVFYDDQTWESFVPAKK
jgi:DNA-binding XRE family transcriptional regulator